MIDSDGKLFPVCNREQLVRLLDRGAHRLFKKYIAAGLKYAFCYRMMLVRWRKHYALTSGCCSASIAFFNESNATLAPTIEQQMISVFADPFASQTPQSVPTFGNASESLAHGIPLCILVPTIANSGYSQSAEKVCDETVRARWSWTAYYAGGRDLESSNRKPKTVQEARGAVRQIRMSLILVD